MTNTELQKPFSHPEGRRGLLYFPGDEWAWEQQIRDVQDRTFAVDGYPVESHDRQVAFHRAAARVERSLADQERRNLRAFKGIPGRVDITETSVIRTARQQARFISGYRRPWTYAVGAVIAALSLTAATVVMFWPRTFLNWLLVELPPREEWTVDGALVDRVASVGAWTVMGTATVVLVFGVFALVLSSVDAPPVPRLRKINHQLWMIFMTCALAGVVAVGGMSFVAIIIAALVEMPTA